MTDIEIKALELMNKIQKERDKPFRYSYLDRSENTKSEALCRTIQELEWLRSSADGWEADSLRYAHNAEYWKAEAERFREALESVLAHRYGDWCYIARAALEKQP